MSPKDTACDGGLLFGQRYAIFGRRVGSLFPIVEEVCHRDPPFRSQCLDTWYDRAAPCPGGQEVAHHLQVANRGREPHAPRNDTSQSLQPLQETERLTTTIATKKGVDLVDDHKAQVTEERRYLRVAVHEHGFKTLRRDLQDARRMSHQLFLLFLRHVAVPVPDLHATFAADVVEPHKLVVDEGFQRCDIQTADGSRWLLLQQRDDREESRLGLARRRGGREQDIGLGVEDGIARRSLDGAERLPALFIDIVLDGRRISCEDVHSVNSAKSVPAVLCSFCCSSSGRA